MKLYAPDFFSDFKCIANECKHSCCIGWEIDIDEETYFFYKSLKGEIGQRLNENISVSDGVPYFTLTTTERCPFLDENGLCDIIISLGENNLCQICADHPRFRNYYSDRVEVGLGMCCEAVAALVLKKKDITKIIELSCDESNEILDEEDLLFFTYRNEILDIIQNRNKNIDSRILEIINRYEIKFQDRTICEWMDKFLQLEYMGKDLKLYFEKLKVDSVIQMESCLNFETAFEQLAVYFIYRHLANKRFEHSLKAKTSFAILSVKIIKELCNLKSSYEEKITLNDLIEFTRLYSSEIEYSEENMQAILSWLEE